MSLMLKFDEDIQCCGLCPIHQRYKHKRRQYICPILFRETKKILSVYDFAYERPNNCPLFEIPSQKPVYVNILRNDVMTRQDVHNEGWNDCLNEFEHRAEKLI